MRGDQGNRPAFFALAVIVVIVVSAVALVLLLVDG